MRELRLGIIGLHNHYHAYPFAEELVAGIPGLKLVAVADEREDLAREFASEFCAGDWTADYEALIRRDDIDAVIITSYTSIHADQTEIAAEAGKPVLLDKPISTTLDDADRIVAAGKRVPVMLAYLLRYLPAYRKVYEAIQAGAVGELTSGFYSIKVPAGFIKESPHSSERGWYADPVKGGGGGFLDHGVHFTDFFRWFFGSEAKSVTAHIGSLTYKDLGVDDYGIATYTLESGAIVTVESTWHAADWTGPLSSPDHASLNGTKGEIELHYQKSPQTEIQGTEEPWTGRTYYDFVGRDRYERCYRDLLVEFGAAVREGRQPVPDAVDGRKALEMILAAYESAETGRRIEFPFVRAGAAA
jgi:predicted dehydrogenase